MFFLQKGLILLLVMGSSFLALTAMITDYWATIPSKSLHMGLFRICDQHKSCNSLVGTDNPKNLLIAVFVIGMFFLLPCGILEVWYARKGRLGTLLFVGAISCLQVILTFAGVVSGAVLISDFLKMEVFYFSWSFALGWISVIISAALVGLSFYINKVEPRSHSPTGTEGPVANETNREVQVAVIPVPETTVCDLPVQLNPSI
ncbi:uncharacterized protein LOC116412203 [Xenopus tropicalis]|uniref:Uncharacterized protein LOC116412203 n=1 Tax=Xenopus tropicalis TaxID=8364 RepID=A0A8J1JV25_XENTR|nr:uncharacterized protein LOC116412203 [Xenopus tropicalis]